MDTQSLIAMLHTFPENDKEVGFNSGIITMLKGLPIQLQRGEAVKLSECMYQPMFNGLNQTTISEVIDAKANNDKLRAVKIFKEATGFGLKEAKDIMDIYFEK